MSSRQLRANAIRFLSMDAVQRAKSGHPGAPMGMADIAEVLWHDHLSHNPRDPNWMNRDRFVLSNGHGSMLLYSLLHLSGYGLSIEDLKAFRQLHAKTAGHPEYGYAPGIETTTGPLGQGLANGVGMAIAEKALAAEFNQNQFQVIDHFTYVFLGDGCLMEGISHEVCSLAGTLRLGKLICFYDDNGISIDGQVDRWFTDDTQQRFESYGWQVIGQVDGHNPSEIEQAIQNAKANTSQPTLICCRTTIGFGSPNKAGSEKSHGAPLGEGEIELCREALNWPHAPFDIPDDVYAQWQAIEQGQKAQAQWQKTFDQYQQAYPGLAKELLRRVAGELPENFQALSDAEIQAIANKEETIASRKASQQMLEFLGPILPELMGGSADLAHSNLTLWQGAKGIQSDDAAGNYIYYGVREFGMSAIMNGIALHKGFIPYGATFLVFMEYARNAVRMAALMGQRSIFVYTHDSIGLGEDGPTHQPIEQLANLRMTPNLNTWRPCDAVESAVAWQQSLVRENGPSALIFSRQSLSHQKRTSEQVDLIKAGAYVLVEEDNPQQDLDLILLATGSEVSLCIEAQRELKQAGLNVRVVSAPCLEVFSQQSVAYQQHVLPKHGKRLAVEASHKDYWYKWVGLNGAVIGMDGFGASAPANLLFAEYGFTVDNLVKTAQTLIK